MQSIERSGNASGGTCLSALPQKLGGQRRAVRHFAGDPDPDASYLGIGKLG